VENQPKNWFIGEKLIKNMIQIRIPEKVNSIMNTLKAAGHEAYIVGGCVRDSILGKIPADWDITTSASPCEVKALFPRSIDTGILHGTVTVMMGREGFEVTTYRIDGKYEDCRHPKKVQFTKSLREDLMRRDFTINAMAYSDETGLVDIFDGIGDLRRGRIRCVGNPEDRFCEDALRMMRAIRFSAQLGFSLEEKTRGAIQSLCSNLQKVSAERIQVELVKLLISPYPEKILDAWETGLTKVFLPEFDDCMECEQNNPNHDCSVGLHTVRSIQNIEADKVLRLTMLLHDFGKPCTKTTDENGVDHFYKHPKESERLAEAILRRLKFDNDTIFQVKKLVLCHDDHPPLKASSVRRAANRIGEELFPLYLKVRRADTLAQSADTQEAKLTEISQIEQIYHKIMEDRNCFTIKQLAVTGHDLMAAGISQGPEVGRTLSYLLEQVMENPEYNDKEWLLSEAVRFWKTKEEH